MRTTDDEIRIADADFPKPFQNGLEFNAPVHGTWNIVHIGLQMPEAIQVYVCAKNCMRGVILTAAEMNASDRFSFVILDEKDMVRENIDQATIEGVADVIAKRTKAGQRPKAIQLFTVCVHHFLGSDYKQIYKILGERFPDIDFYRCYMDPIMQKKGFTPDQKLRRAMFEKLPDLPVKENVIAVLGSDFSLDESSDMVRLIRQNGFTLRQSRICKTYEEFLTLSEAALFIAVYPPAKMGVEAAAKRLGRKFMYLPSGFDEQLIDEQLGKLQDYMDRVRQKTGNNIKEENTNNTEAAENPEPSESIFIKESPKADENFTSSDSLLLSSSHKEVTAEVKELKKKVGDIPIFLDATVHPRILGLAHLLIENGMNVRKVFLDAMSSEEETDYNWLKENAPDVILSAIIHVKKRRYVKDIYRHQVFEDSDETINLDGKTELLGNTDTDRNPNLFKKKKVSVSKIAIGQKAAYFEQTPYFVNMVSGFGLHGRDGMVRMLEMIAACADKPKDIEDIVPRKGLGCESCI